MTDPVAERESQSKLSGPFLLASALVIHLECNKMHSYYFMKEEPNMKTRRRSSVLNNSIILYKQLYNVLTLTRHFDIVITNKSCVYQNISVSGLAYDALSAPRGQRVEAGTLLENQSWFLLLIATDHHLPLSGLTSKQIWKLHSVTWCVMRGYRGLKLLFHLTLCNKVNIFLLSTDEFNSNPTIEMRCAEQETVAGDLDNHSSHDQHRRRGYIRRKISKQKAWVTADHHGYKQTPGGNVDNLLLHTNHNWNWNVGSRDAAKKEQISQPWISQVENHGRHPLFGIECVFIDIFNFPPICCFINEPVAVWFIGFEFSVSSFPWHTFEQVLFSYLDIFWEVKCVSCSPEVGGHRSLHLPGCGCLCVTRGWWWWWRQLEDPPHLIPLGLHCALNRAEGKLKT